MKKILLGVIIGLLIAPKRGSELINDVYSYLNKTYDDLKEMDKEDLQGILENVKEAITKIDVNKTKDDVYEKLVELRERIEDVIENVNENEHVQNVVGTIKVKASELSKKMSKSKEESSSTEEPQDLDDRETA